MAEVTVLSSKATQEAYHDLVPQFEQSTGHKVRTTFTGTVDIEKRLAAGEVHDLVIVSEPTISDEIGKGRLLADSRINLAKSGIGIAVRSGTPRPDVSSIAALKNALLGAKSIGYTTGPSGVYMASLLERLGIADQVKARVKQTPSGVMIPSVLASGDVEIGFQQVSELVNSPGIDFLGPLPADAQHVTVFAAAVHSGAKQPDAARALVKFLTTPAAVAVMQKRGLEPG
jgi:molybdate transport system substrate-binding protein